VAEVVWASAYLLSGLRWSPEVAAEVFRGVVTMKESSTYQAIIAEGRAIGVAEGRAEGRAEGAVAEAKKLLRTIGEGKFGPPDPSTADAIESIDDLVRLETLCGRLPKAGSWKELLGNEPPRARRRRRST
jgi:hypothetical protein